MFIWRHSTSNSNRRTCNTVGILQCYHTRASQIIWMYLELMTHDLETYRPKWTQILMQLVYVYLMTATKLRQVMFVKCYWKRCWRNRSSLIPGTSTICLFLLEFNATCIFSIDFRKYSIIKFQENPCIGSQELFGRTDRHDEVHSCFTQFC